MTETDWQQANGQAPDTVRRDEIRVRFGPRPTQVVPLDWAESMLTELKRINPGLFGKLLTAAAGVATTKREGSRS